MRPMSGSPSQGVCELTALNCCQLQRLLSIHQPLRDQEEPTPGYRSVCDSPQTKPIPEAAFDHNRSVEAIARRAASDATTGGNDKRLPNNVACLEAMQSTCQTLQLSHSGPAASVVFLPNISQSDKLTLLESSRALALLYTPINEHLGIVPLEAMGSGLPVVACDSGGPLETIVDEGFDHPETTGFLLSPSQEAWSQIMEALAHPSASERRRAIGQAGQKRVQERSSTPTWPGSSSPS
jgi:hypothetical protein